MQDNLYVLMLVYVDEQWLDIAGNKYSDDGFIEADEFTKDIDISKGLCGILWGKTYHLPYEKVDGGHWLVVKTELSDNLVRTDYNNTNRYKFKDGWVIHSGGIKSCADFILKQKDNPKHDFMKHIESLSPEEIVGTEEWKQTYKELQYR